MQGRVGVGFVALVSVALVPIAQNEGVAHATVKPPIVAVPVRSSFETATRSLSRDIGLSVALPDGHALWLFGDTGTYQRSGAGWERTGFLDGSSAILARYTPGRVPHGGELPSGRPSRFLPVPKKVYLPDGSGRPCAPPYPTAAFSARWPTGAAVMGSNPSEVLVTYAEVCVTRPKSGVAVQPEGWGYVLYNWRTRRIDRGPIDVFKPRTNGKAIGPSKSFGWPHFSNGQLTLFASHCASQYVGCLSGEVWSVTMPAKTAAFDNPASYRLRPLSTDGSSQWEPLSISVGRYSDGWRLVELTSITGRYKIFAAPTAGAKWQLAASGTLPGCVSRAGFCFALEGHPELSTATDTFVSYKAPDSGPGGHVVVTALPD